MNLDKALQIRNKMDWKKIKRPYDLPDEGEIVEVQINNKAYSARLITNEFEETVWEVATPVQFAPPFNFPKQQLEQLGIETEFNLPAPTHWRKP